MRCNPWALALVVIPGIACAHTGDHGAMSFAAGLTHPFTGLDHLLAMLGVGVIAGRSQGVVRLWLPLCFLAAMAFGGVLAAHGLPLPLVETMIALSVALTCAAVLASLRLPTHLVGALAALFAVFHGYAHGAEMSANVAAVTYGAGYVTATALLLAIGVLTGSHRPFALESDTDAATSESAAG